MAATLEATRGGGGSVKVGAVGTISTLMTREIESSSSTASLHSLAPVACSNGPLKSRKSMNEASSSRPSTSIKHSSPEALKKTKGRNHITTTTTPKARSHKSLLEGVGNDRTVHRISKSSPDLSGRTRNHKRSSHIPMLGSENIQLEKTPVRNKPVKKGSNIVDIVDINCSNPGGSISNRLKKLNFSKLSQSFM